MYISIINKFSVTEKKSEVSLIFGNFIYLFIFSGVSRLRHSCCLEFEFVYFILITGQIDFYPLRQIGFYPL